MDNIFKFFFMISILIGFSISTMANENSEKMAIKKVKDALLTQVKTENIDQKIQNRVKMYSKNMRLDLSALTHTILKKEISYSIASKNRKVNIVLKENDISFHFSFIY